MNGIEKSNRRVEMSAVLSDAVYEYEKAYTSGQQDPTLKADDVLKKAGINTKSYEIVDSMYDKDSGVAAIAVKDKLTEETYISYAGTNYKADGHKDIIVDAAIGINDSLYLKKKNKPALDFYDRVEAKGNYITTTTGHSYGEFQAGRVALERQVPYNYGYQGAPQSVNGKTAQQMIKDGDSKLFNEILVNKDFDHFKTMVEVKTNQTGLSMPSDKVLKQYWTYFSSLKNISPEMLKSSEKEAKRIEELRKNYKGQSITFSSTRDVLTNLVWNQNKLEIQFEGQALDGAFLQWLLDANTPGILDFAGISMETKYPGRVVAIDLPIYHNMTAYRKSEEAMQYTKQIVLEQLFTVDIEGDGILDFAVTPENTTTRDLLPKSGDSLQVKIDTTSMTILITNLKVCLKQAQNLASVTQQTLQANENVMNNLSSRINNLKEVVFQHLQSISLIEAIQKIDKAYSHYNSITGTFDTLSNYDSYEFSRKFDWRGSSIFYDYLDSAGNVFNHGAITSKLNGMNSNALNIEADINMHKIASEGKYGNIWPQANMYTKFGTKGAELVNSFEDMIEKSTNGLANRSHFGDGIPQAVDEILKVLAQNIQTIISCISYTISVAELIKSALEETDRGLARNIDTLNFSSIPDVNISVSQDYNAYLEESGIFDDRDVISAFDDQIDVKSEALANQMSPAFSDYLDSVKAAVEHTNKVMTTAKYDLQTIVNEFPTKIYYKLKSDDKNKKKLYSTVEPLISVSGVIRTAISDIDSVDLDLTTASTTINTVLTMLGGFKPVFRNGMEDAFYGAAHLQGIVRAQKAVATVIKSLQIRFVNLKGDLESLSSGAASGALGYKLGDMTNLMGNVSHVIDDCFGN